MSVFLIAFRETQSGLLSSASSALARVTKCVGDLSQADMMRAWPTPSGEPDVVVVQARDASAVTAPVGEAGVEVLGVVQLLAGSQVQAKAEELYDEILPNALPAWLPVIDGIESPWEFCPLHGYPHAPPIHSLPPAKNGTTSLGP